MDKTTWTKVRTTTKSSIAKGPSGLPSGARLNSGMTSFPYPAGPVRAIPTTTSGQFELVGSKVMPVSGLGRGD